MAKLPVTQGATRRAYSRAAWQARRRWLATKLMGQQPRRAEHERGEPAGAARHLLPCAWKLQQPRGREVCMPVWHRAGRAQFGGPASLTTTPPTLDKTWALQIFFHLPHLLVRNSSNGPDSWQKYS